MIYYRNKSVKIIAVDRSLISVVSLDRPNSVGIWVKASELSADEGIVEILDKAKETEDWQIEHHSTIDQTPLPIKKEKRKGKSC